MMSEKERSTSSSSPSRKKQRNRGGHSSRSNSYGQDRGNNGYSSRKRGRKRRRSQDPNSDAQPLFLSKETKAPVEHEDEFFGNRKDYNMKNGGGFDGYYREPMDGGTKWGYQNMRKHTQDDPHYQEGVLSMHQPGWKNQLENSDDSGLTIRQQDGLAQSLRWDDNQPYTMSKQENGQDPARAWQHFMNDLSRGKKAYQEKKRRSRRRRHKKPQQQG